MSQQTGSVKSVTQPLGLLEKLKHAMKTLSKEQLLLFKKAKQQANIYMTGGAGSGKTYVLSIFIQWVRIVLGDIDAVTGESLTDEPVVYATATTGQAATFLEGGSTIHSCAGIGKGDQSFEDTYRAIRRRPRDLKRWQRMKVLIIDEISMLDARLFGLLNFVAQRCRNSMEPFGGIQVIVCGDFFQLPPVRGEYAFQCPEWDLMNFYVVLLTKIYRQNNTTYVELLNQLRFGIVPKNAKHLISSAHIDYRKCDIRMEATHLFSRNARVNAMNNAKLAKLPGTPKTYRGVVETCNLFSSQHEIVYMLPPFHLLTAAQAKGPPPSSMQPPYEKAKPLRWVENRNMDDDVAEKICDRFIHDINVPLELTLKLHAQVMLAWNLNTKAGLVNGTPGTVSCLDPLRVTFVTSRFPHGIDIRMPKQLWIQWQDGRVKTAFEQYPLRLAYAASIHRCQGATIQQATVHLENATEYGHVYVALSRVPDLYCMEVNGFDPTNVQAHPEVLAWYRSLIHQKKRERERQKKRKLRQQQKASQSHTTRATKRHSPSDALMGPMKRLSVEQRN